jgi:hypothetical protein
VGEQIGYAVVPQAPAASVHPGVGREGRTASSPRCITRYGSRAMARRRGIRWCCRMRWGPT